MCRALISRCRNYCSCLITLCQSLTSRCGNYCAAKLKHLHRCQLAVFLLFWCSLVIFLAVYGYLDLIRLHDSQRDPIRTRQVRNLEAGQFPRLGLVVVETGLEREEGCITPPLGRKKCPPPTFYNTMSMDHDFAFFQDVSDDTDGYNYFDAKVLFVRPKADAIRSAGVKHKCLSGWEEGGVSSGVSYAQYNAVVKVSSFTLPFSYNDIAGRSSTIVPSDEVECLLWHLKWRHPDNGLMGDWAPCKPLHGKFTMNTGNWSTACAKDAQIHFNDCTGGCCKGTAVMENFSWPRACPECCTGQHVRNLQCGEKQPFFIVLVPTDELEGQHKSIQDLTDQWMQDFPTCVVGPNNYGLQTNGMFEDLSKRLTESVSNGAFVDLTENTMFELKSAGCEGFGCDDSPLTVSASTVDLTKKTTFASRDAGEAPPCVLKAYSYPSGNPVNQPDNLTCATGFTANFVQDITVGSTSITYGAILADLFSYMNTGLRIIAFVFPTALGVSYHYKFGRRRKLYKEKLEGLGDEAAHQQLFLEVVTGHSQRP